MGTLPDAIPEGEEGGGALRAPCRRGTLVNGLHQRSLGCGSTVDLGLAV